MKYYVDAKVGQTGDGCQEKPFKTIGEAAALAVAGDEVIVAPGLYREWVNPINGGTEDKRIVYKSEVPLGAHITGAEKLGGWTVYGGVGSKVYTARVSNKIFGDYNPYTSPVCGDWFIPSASAHTGDVFLNGKSMYEVGSVAEVEAGDVSVPSWDHEFSSYKWHAEQDLATDETVFYANFQGKDPNNEDVEITVRQACFYPKEEGRGYITLSGFKVSKALKEKLN